VQRPEQDNELDVEKLDLNTPALEAVYTGRISVRVRYYCCVSISIVCVMLLADA
jgi:hypothetical protein